MVLNETLKILPVELYPAYRDYRDTSILYGSKQNIDNSSWRIYYLYIEIIEIPLYYMVLNKTLRILPGTRESFLENLYPAYRDII